MNKDVKNEELKNEFVKLADLKADIVKKFVRVPIRMNRRATDGGLNVRMQLVLNPINLVIPMVSYQTVNGIQRKLPFYSPDRFIALLFELNLPQEDERGMDQNHWVFNAPIRFVKGKNKSGEDYHQIEIVFKQYNYETIFLSTHQLQILNALEQRKELKDYQGKPYSIKWEIRPDIIDDISEDIYNF